MSTTATSPITTTTSVTGERVHAVTYRGVRYVFVANDRGNPPGKLADAEIHFDDGPCAGLKLIGFAIWERKNGGRNVTFPARQYSVNGERRSFALLRPTTDPAHHDRFRDLMIEAYAEYEAAQS